jgi:hypothetical protein
MEPQGELEKVVSRNQSKQQDKHTHIEREWRELRKSLET